MNLLLNKDHLGNTRLTFFDRPAGQGPGQGGTVGQIEVPEEILQENHYYPFGMNLGGTFMNDGIAKDNAYQYNGKELESFGGLGWNDYGARFYDPSIGRWNAIDPLAEKYIGWSPYNYGMNNPIVNIDPNGMESITYYGEEAQEAFRQLQSQQNRNNDSNGDDPPGLFYSLKKRWNNFADKLFGATNDRPTASEFTEAAHEGAQKLEPLVDGLSLVVPFSSAVDPRLRPAEATGLMMLEAGFGLVPFGKLASKGVPLNRLNHIFGKAEHALESLVNKFGSQEGAFDAVQNAANKAFKAEKLTPNAKGILPSGDLGNIINVGGIDVRLIGGRVENGQVILSSFSRKGL